MFVQIRDSANRYHGIGLADCKIQDIIDRYTEQLKKSNTEIKVMLIGEVVTREAMDILRG